MILATESLTRRAPRGATRLRNGPSIYSRFIVSNSALSLQGPGEPRPGELTNRTRTSVEVWGSEDVSRRSAQTCVSLIPGCRWSSVFLYVYTGQITFTAIGSQHVPSKTMGTQDGYSVDERHTPQDSGGLSVPPPDTVVNDPCSPKSIYRLAEKVCPASLLDCVVTGKSFTQIGLAELCNTAFEDIRSKLDENNIVGELFSPFTAE